MICTSIRAGRKRCSRPQLSNLDLQSLPCCAMRCQMHQEVRRGYSAHPKVAQPSEWIILGTERGNRVNLEYVAINHRHSGINPRGACEVTFWPSSRCGVSVRVNN